MLKAGFARLDVTPPLHTWLAGYFFDRFATGVLDPLYVNAVAVSNDETKAVIITVDSEAVCMDSANILRQQISEKCNIPTENIIISGLHQHTAPMLTVKGYRKEIHEDKEYNNVLYRKIVDAAEMAVNDMSDAVLSFGAEETSEKLAFIRRYYMKDGSIRTNPGGEYKNVVRPYRDADNTVRLCKFKREGKKDIAFVNFSTHPDVIHGDKFSADWPGFVRTYVEQDLGVHCITTVGAQGDSNHADFTLPQHKDGYEHSKHMGRIITDAVVKMWNNTKEVKGDKIEGNYEVIFNKTRTDGIDDYEEAKAFMEYSEKNNLLGGEYITQLTNARRIMNLRTMPIFRQVPVTVIKIGEVGIVGFGGEPFTEYADKVREGAEDKFVISMCQGNGGEGYLTTLEAHQEGGYEASATSFSPDLEEQCVGTALKFLNK